MNFTANYLVCGGLGYTRIMNGFDGVGLTRHAEYQLLHIIKKFEPHEWSHSYESSKNIPVSQ